MDMLLEEYISRLACAKGVDGVQDINAYDFSSVLQVLLLGFSAYDVTVSFSPSSWGKADASDPVRSNSTSPSPHRPDPPSKARSDSRPSTQSSAP